MYKLVDESGHLTPPLTEEVIDATIVKYAKDAPDLGYGHLSHTISPISKFFNFLLENATDDDGRKIFHELFYGFYLHEYTPEDILKFLENRRLELTFENIELFLSLSRKSDNYEYKKFCVYSALYPYIFYPLDSAVKLNIEGINRLNKDIEHYAADELNKSDYRVNARLNPLDIRQTESFRNFRIAVDQYLQIIKGMTEPDYSSQIPLINDILRLLYNDPNVLTDDNTVPNHFLLNDNQHISMFYNIPNADLYNKELGMLQTHPNLKPNFTDIDRGLDLVLSKIINEIDSYNSIIWENYSDIAEQIYQLESKLRSIQLPPNIFTSWSPGFSNVIAGIKNVAISLFAGDKYVDTEYQSTFNQVGYNYGVDFLLDYGADNNLKVYGKSFLDMYPGRKTIYLVSFNDYAKPVIANANTTIDSVSLKKIADSPLLYGSTFVDNQFTVLTQMLKDDEGNDTETSNPTYIWVRNRLIKKEYFDDNGVLKSFDPKVKPEDNQSIWKWADKSNENYVHRIIRGDNIFTKTPSDWIIGDDFILHKDEYDTESPKNRTKIQIFINEPAFRSDSVRTPNMFWSIGDPEFMSVKDDNLYAYLYSWSFFKTEAGSTLDIITTEDFGSGNLRALYNLLDTTSHNTHYSTVDLDVQNQYGTTFIGSIRNTVASTVGEIGEGFNKAGDFFQNLYAKAKNIVQRSWDDVLNVIDFIPNRIRKGYQTQIYLEKIIERLTASLKMYRKRQIIYSELYLNREEIISSSDGIAYTQPLFDETNPDIYQRLVKNPIIQTVENMLNPLNPTNYPSEIISRRVANILNKNLRIPESTLLDSNSQSSVTDQELAFPDELDPDSEYQDLNNKITAIKTELLKNNKFYTKEEDPWLFI